MRNLMIFATILVGLGTFMAQMADKMSPAAASATTAPRKAAVGLEMAAGVARNAQGAAGGWCFRLDDGSLSRSCGRGSRRRRHLVRHLRHEGAEADQDGGKDHQVTHDATHSFPGCR
jgi:hypothetical protein